MRKIDVEKSTILSVNEGDTDLKLGIKGYFSHYSNFETYVEGELEGFTYSEYMTTEEDLDGDYGNQWYDYFIPEDKVVFKEEPKKLRPYKNISEFLDTVRIKIGDVITIKRINCGYEYEDTILFIGFRITEKENQKYPYVF